MMLNNKSVILWGIVIAAVLLAMTGGAVFAFAQFTRDVTASVSIQLIPEDGIEVYLDEGLTEVATSLDFDTVVVDFFGSVGESPSVPVWIHNRSLSTIRLSVDDDFDTADVVFMSGEQEPLLAPDEVLPGVLTLEFHEGIEAGIRPFTIFVIADGPIGGPPLPVEPPSGLVSWWPGDDNADDIVGGNNGTLQGDTIFTPGMVGQAFSFDGVDDYVRITNAQNIPATGPFSAEAWIKYDSSDPAGINPEVLTIGGFPFCPSGGIHAILLGGKTAPSIGRGCEPAPDFACGVPHAGIGDNTWHHVATVWNGTNSFVYIDGILRAQCPGTDYTRATTHVSLGGRPDEDTTHAPYKGQIDEATIYNRALRDDEIKAIFDAGSAGKIKPKKPGPIINPGNDHFYEAVTVPGGINWLDAKAEAESRTFMDIQGHLATITSQDENDFIVDNFPEEVEADDFGYWLGGFQPPESSEPNGNWQWVTGEDFVFTNWDSGEPNDADPGEEVMEFSGSPGGEWNDVPGTEGFMNAGYVVEYAP